MKEWSSHTSMSLEERLASLEVDAVGVASVDGLAEGLLRDQVLALLPEARSVITVAMEVFPEVLDHSSPGKMMGEASARDLLVTHQEYLSSRLNKAVYDVANLCRRQGHRSLPMPAANYPTDQRYLSSILSYKHAAVAAGMGSIGRHSLLVTPRFGPRVRLACLLTEAELPATSEAAEELCDGCNNCIASCPAGALVEPESGASYSMNKYACSVYRGGAGNCAECMKVCPLGR